MPVKRQSINRQISILRYIIPIILFGFFIVSSSGLLFFYENQKPITASEPELRIWFFDIGQGDAIFVETPTKEQFLIDGGRDDAVLAKLGTVMNPWDRKIDGIFLTHPDADHVAGLVSVLENYQVNAIYETGATRTSSIMEAFEDATELENSNHEYLDATDQISLGEVLIEVVSPTFVEPGKIYDDANSLSLVLKVTYKDTTVLLTGDATKEAEEEFAIEVGDIDVIKVGHHGSNTSTSNKLLSEVTPEIAVIQVGENSYGHPHPIVMERLNSRGIDIYRNDLDGDILLTSNGGEPEVFAAPLPF